MEYKYFQKHKKSAKNDPNLGKLLARLLMHIEGMLIYFTVDFATWWILASKCLRSYFHCSSPNLLKNLE